MENSKRFINKRVLVTGGALGIGKAIVEAFAKEGAEVFFFDRNFEAGIELKHKYNDQLHFSCGDITHIEELEAWMNKVFTKYGDIDVLVNNAGISQFSSILDTTVDSFDRTLKTNLRPVFVTSRCWALFRSKLSESQPEGRIINIASTRYLMSEANSEAYAASKGGIVSLTHALAMSLSPYNITVNAISPGWIQNTNYEELSEADHEMHPSGRVGRPEDIAEACLYFAQGGNNFINGQNLIIDGGMTKKMIY